MEQLGKKEHDALVLRFFEDKNFKEVAAALGASEDTARMRVNRALEKLRKFFTKRGVVSTTAIIAGAISANSVQAAPVALAKSVTAVAIAKGVAASGSTLTLIKGALKIMVWTKAKTAIVACAVVLLVAGTATLAIKQIEAQGTLRIRVRVDGSDTLKISGNKLWFEHDNFLLPENPIYVGGVPWSPRWNKNTSTRFMGLIPAFNPRNGAKIKVITNAGRGMVRIKQLPTPENHQTLSVLINDNDYNGYDWYEFTISW
jgi:hypothetical protein